MEITTAEVLRAAAKRLRLGVPGPENAAVLEALATAIEKPDGYTLKVLGALDHEFFLPTFDAADQAAKDAGYTSDEYQIVGVVALWAQIASTATR